MKRLALAFLAMAAASWPQYPAARHGGGYMHNYYLPPAPSTTPWWPAWAPDGKTLAVAMHGSLWRVDPQTGIAAELTYSPHYLSSPDWSPDGRWIVHTADRDGKGIHLAILNVTTGEVLQLTSDDALYADPVFSPDGFHLAYVATAPNGYFNIYIRSIREGSWEGAPIALTKDRDSGRARLYVGAYDMHTQPAWTPDGRSLLYVDNRDAPLGSRSLWRMPVEPMGIAKAAIVLAELTLFRTRPHVSPDGRRIIYSSHAGGSDQYDNLYVLPVEGGAPYKLTHDQNDKFHPRWSPDGERIAYLSNSAGVPELWILNAHTGARRRVTIKERRWRRPMGRISVRVVDAATGLPIPARLHGLAADGKFYAPAGEYSRIGANVQHLFHTSGEAVFDVAPGPITLTAVKGLEFEPASAAATVRPGEAARVELRLRRLAEMESLGWRSGSTHVHMNYGGNLHNTPENLLRMARAEGLRFVMDLVANKDNRIFDYQHYIPGADLHPASGDARLHVGEEYRPAFYGHIFLLGLRDHLVAPFAGGYERTGIASLYPSNTDILRHAASQSALTGYVHAFNGDADPLERGLGNAKGFPVDAAALSNASSGRGPLGPSCAFGITRSTMTCPSSRLAERTRSPIFTARASSAASFTYAKTGSADSLQAWWDAIRAGKTFFTTGPLITFRAGGQDPGDRIRLPKAGGEVEFSVKVSSIAPLSRVVIHRNGEEFRVLPLEPGGRRVAWREKMRVSASAWFSVYAEGPSFPLLDSEYPQAATNAIRFYVGDQPIRRRQSAAYFLRWIDKLKQMAASSQDWRSDRERQHVLEQFEEAGGVYRRLAAEDSTEGPKGRLAP